MNKTVSIILISLFFIRNAAFGQGGTWTWISGDNAPNSTGVFGTQGVPSVNNHPPGFYEPCEWKDRQGNFWIYGGTFPSNSDLWKYNPVTSEWTWVKGNGLSNQPAVYGIQGVPDPANTPGSRSLAVTTWVDTSGTFWLFGGDDNTNDLWSYDIGTNEWTWMKGNTVNAKGVYVTQGFPDIFNNPNPRWETCSAWTDSLNNLWLFGGRGHDSTGTYGFFNDLCKYNVNTNEWTWIKGSPIAGAPASYGTKGVANASNDPGARQCYTNWKDVQGNFWIMGGYFNYNCYNDVWKYDVSANEWTWMNGSNLINDPGNYTTECSFNADNMPYSRAEQRSSVTDNCGRFWQFGGFSNYGDLSDLWVFDPQQLKWNWISGTAAQNQPGDYGTLGIPSPANMPPSRRGAVAWWGNDNKFYMFGGLLNNTSARYSDVWVFSADTSCIAVCNSTVLPPPQANFQSNKTAICVNDCVNFTDLSTNATSWQWNFAGGSPSISTDTNPQVCYLTTGIYDVTLIASNSGGSDSVTFSNYINVKTAPITPVIIQIGTMLYCSTDSTYTSYQWYDDTTLIAGATDTLLVISQNGNYNVQVSNANGCKTAVGINIILGIQNYMNDNNLSLSPNPATDELTVNGYRFVGNETLTIYNILGERIYYDAINSKRKIVNCKHFPSGIYLVQVVSESRRWLGRFVKQ